MPACVAQPEDESDLWVESSCNSESGETSIDSTKYVGTRLRGEFIARVLVQMQR